MKKDSI